MTHRQLQLLRFICGFQAAKGFSPSFNEMCDGLGYARGAGSGGRQPILEMLKRLEEDGYIRRARYRARSIEVLRPVSYPFTWSGVPLYVVNGSWAA